MSRACDFKISNSHIKKKKKQDELMLMIYFYGTQYVQSILMLTCKQHKKMNETFYILFFILNLQNPVCIFLMAHLHEDLLYFKCVVATCGSWLPYKTEQL